MGIHTRQTRMFAVVGVLALGGASAVAAQDTSAASRQDTSGYQQSGSQTDTTQTGAARSGASDTSQYKYHGAPTDTALKAKPGVQTGPTAGDTGRMHRRRHHMRMSAMDTVVCKDGSNSPNSSSGACGSHGGVDTAATWAALKARGGYHGNPSQGAPSDSSSRKSRSSSDTSAGKSSTSSDTSAGKSSTSSDTSSSSSTRSSP